MKMNEDPALCIFVYNEYDNYRRKLSALGGNTLKNRCMIRNETMTNSKEWLANLVQQKEENTQLQQLVARWTKVAQMKPTDFNQDTIDKMYIQIPYPYPKDYIKVPEDYEYDIIGKLDRYGCFPTLDGLTYDEMKEIKKIAINFGAFYCREYFGLYL